MLAFLLVLMTINYYGYALTCISLIVYEELKRTVLRGADSINVESRSRAAAAINFIYLAFVTLVWLLQDCCAQLFLTFVAIQTFSHDPHPCLFYLPSSIRVFLLSL